ncbi:zinc finger Y-chromosomal protein isoform 2 [Cricetulus griseus]|nr:zinc finger Y-chromosomal protein isoform 2 [Cricetulus griseus]
MKKYSDWSRGDKHYGRSGYSSREPHTSYRYQKSQTREEVLTPALKEHAISSSPMAMAVVSGTVDIVESEPENDHGVELLDPNNSIRVPREKMVYMTVNDSQQEDEDLNVAEIADEVYMEVIVGEEDAAAAAAAAVHEQQIDDNEMKTFMPIAWAAAYEQATQSQTTVLVVTSGAVKFDGNKQHFFNQNFLLTAHSTPTSTVWKIASDCFRFQDWANI